MKKIVLTQNKFAIVDDEDFERINQFHWWFDGSYTVREKMKNRKKTKIYLHRFILNPPENMEVDHINRNKLDNRKCNLRIVTHAQQNWNKPQIKGKYKGITFDKSRNKWASTITFNGKLIHLGRFGTPEKAALIYNQAAKKYYGEYAYLNNL